MTKKLWLFFIFTWFISCNDSKETIITPIDNSWHKNDTKKIDFEINDAQSPKNIIFVLRNNNEYPYSNLFLISSLKNEKNEVLKKDTMHYILARPNGEWLGTGWGSTKEILLQYRTKLLFPTNGKYILELKHGMRTDNLKGLEDIGIIIEQTNTTP